jgi:hypothetical protein
VTPLPLHVAVAVSINGGQSFSPVETFGIFTDQPTVAVGPKIDGTSSVWVTYKDFGVDGEPLVVQGVVDHEKPKNSGRLADVTGMV